MNTPTLQSIEQLSVAERIQLVEDIWDSIAKAPETLAVPESQCRELDARLEVHSQNPENVSTWAQAKARIQN